MKLFKRMIAALALSFALAAPASAMEGQDYLDALMAFNRGGLDRSIDYLYNLSDEGDDDAMYYIGHLYLSAKRYSDAIALFKGADKMGNNKATYWLAVVYMDKNFYDYNPAKAHRYLKKAAEQGLGAAMYHTALQLMDGIGTKPDPEKAKWWMKKAASIRNHFALEKMKEKKWQN